MSFEYIIQMENGTPVNHPMIMSNFTQCFPEVDLENLPENFAFFVRVERPEVNPYQIVFTADPEYIVREDGVVTDNWVITEYTPNQKQAKIDYFLANKPFPSWLFDEETCSCYPPIPYPTDGNKYDWDETTTNWILLQE